MKKLYTFKYGPVFLAHPVYTHLGWANLSTRGPHGTSSWSLAGCVDIFMVSSRLR